MTTLDKKKVIKKAKWTLGFKVVPQNRMDRTPFYIWIKNQGTAVFSESSAKVFDSYDDAFEFRFKNELPIFFRPIQKLGVSYDRKN